MVSIEIHRAAIPAQHEALGPKKTIKTNTAKRLFNDQFESYLAVVLEVHPLVAKAAGGVAPDARLGAGQLRRDIGSD